MLDCYLSGRRLRPGFDCLRSLFLIIAYRHGYQFTTCNSRYIGGDADVRWSIVFQINYAKTYTTYIESVLHHPRHGGYFPLGTVGAKVGNPRKRLYHGPDGRRINRLALSMSLICRLTYLPTNLYLWTLNLGWARAQVTRMTCKFSAPFLATGMGPGTTTSTGECM